MILIASGTHGTLQSHQRVWNRIWCTNCECVREFFTDLLPIDDRNKEVALDIVCLDCNFILATMYPTIGIPQ